MNDKPISYWIALSAIISFLLTTYFWFLSDKSAQPVAEWASAIGTVSAVGLSLWLQFRNESNDKDERKSDKRTEVSRMLLEELSSVEKEIDTTMIELSNEFLKEEHHQEEGVNHRIFLLRSNVTRLYNTNWKLLYLVSEILTDEEILNFKEAGQKLHQEVLVKIYLAESDDDLVALLDENPYKYIDEMRKIILRKYKNI